jgi:HSP20 family protein
VTRRERLNPESLQAEIEELFSDLWQIPRFAGLRRGFRPNVDSYHTNEPHHLVVVVELPGVDPQSLTIVAGERMLLVAGERRRDRPDGRVYQQMEIEYGPFQRQVRLAEDVDVESAVARYEHGILTITLPAASSSPPGQRQAITIERG